MMRTLFILLTIASATAQTWAPPETNRVDWSLAGVPGGILTNRSTIYTSFTASATSSQIQSAINSAPSSTVIYLEPGYYTNTTGSITIDKSSVTLRGAGTVHDLGTNNATIVRFNTITIGGTPTDSAWSANIVSGYTKGSSNIVLGSLSDPISITAGKFFKIAENGNSWFPRSHNGSTTRRWMELARIQSVNTGTKTITIWPPLAHTYDPTNNIVYAINPVSGSWRSLSGIESFTLEGRGASGPSTMINLRGWKNWVYNIESLNCEHQHLEISGKNLQVEVRHCIFNGTGLASDGYGIHFEGADINPIAYPLIIDNIFTGLYKAASMKQGLGAVVAYNFCRDSTYIPNQWVQPDFNWNHGEHSYMMLFEGNHAVGINQDGYHGTSSHTTLFRNNLHGEHPTLTYPRVPLKINRGGYFNWIGANILGSSNWTPTAFYPNASTGAGVANVNHIFLAGMGDISGGGYSASNPNFWPNTENGWDSNVVFTTYFHGNYDYASGTITNMVGQSTNFPNSLFLTDAQGTNLFGTNRWPAFQPESAIKATTIPAYDRWYGLGGPPPPSPPDSPTASANALGKWIRVSWAPVQDADTYVVERSLNDADWTEVDETTLTAYADIDVSWPTLYYYRVTARNENGDSDPSSSVSASPSPLPAASRRFFIRR